MQIAKTFPKGAFPPSQGGNAPDISAQLRQQREEHQRIQVRRAVELWWPRVLLIVLGGITAGIVGQFVFYYPIYIFAPMVALVILFLMAWRVYFGMFMIAIASTALFPQAFSVKALSVYPAIPLLLWLFFVLAVQVAFRIKEAILPSFWAIWPLLGMACLAIISNIVVQVTWTKGVPHKVGNSPIILDEFYGIALFLFPLIIIVVTTVSLVKKERWIEYIQTAFLATSVLLAAIVIFEFKRIGATLYTFRFSDPKLLWMSLKAISQILVLGSMIGYVRMLYSKRWRMRFMYAGATLLCLGGVYLSLQNSWWVEAVVGFAVITIVYSRKLFGAMCLLCLPLIPVVLAEIQKLATVKTADFYRLIIWKDALRVWSKQPLLGVGPGNFWAYDQRFTQLPKYLRDFSKTGLGVSHNGYLQTFGELGPLGLLLYISMIVVIVVVAFRLYQRSKAGGKRSDAMLALVGLGLVCGSALGDVTSGAMFLQPRQVGSSGSLTQVISTWIIIGCILYKDQLWRMARKKLRFDKQETSSVNNTVDYALKGMAN